MDIKEYFVKALESRKAYWIHEGIKDYDYDIKEEILTHDNKTFPPIIEGKVQIWMGRKHYKILFLGYKAMAHTETDAIKLCWQKILSMTIDAGIQLTSSDAIKAERRRLSYDDRIPNHLIVSYPLLPSECYVNKDTAGQQVYDAYPFEMHKDGVTYPLALMDIDLFKELYWKNINADANEHNEVLKDLKYMKEHDMINFKIEKFVRSKAWMGARKLRQLEVDDIPSTDIKQF